MSQEVKRKNGGGSKREKLAGNMKLYIPKLERGSIWKTLKVEGRGEGGRGGANKSNL